MTTKKLIDRLIKDLEAIKLKYRSLFEADDGSQLTRVGRAFNRSIAFIKKVVSKYDQI